MNKIKEIFTNYKKNIFIDFSIVIIIIFLILFFWNRENINKKINNKKDDIEIIDVLKVTYKSGKNIVIDNFSHDFTATKEIVVENTSKEYITYSIDWKNVNNTLNKQSSFIYEIKGTGNNVGNLKASQVPVESSNLFSSLMISPNKRHVYKITFNYDKGILSDKGYFKGYLDFYIKK